MSEYKRTYQGDYSKSYRDMAIWKRENEIKKKEYETISKKLGGQTYNKSEKSNIQYISGERPQRAGDRVNADGSSNRSTTERGKIKQGWYERDVYKPQEKIKPRQKEADTSDKDDFLSQMARDLRESANKGQPATPPPSTLNETSTARPSRRQEPIPTIVEEEEIEDDGNYNFHAYPLEEIGLGRYKNLKTGKVLDVKGAKEVLLMAGYTPKPLVSAGAIFFAFIITNVVLPYLAPVVALGFGGIKLMTVNTTWARTAGNKTYKYNFPVSPEEMSLNKLVGKIAIAVGIAAAAYHYLY